MSLEGESRNRGRRDQTATQRDATDRYAVRGYRPPDRREVLDVLGLSTGDVAPSTWFAWAVEENPYVDHVPLSVVTCDGRVVAVRAATAVPLLDGQATVLALQPRSVAVRPDHRDGGLAAATLQHLADQDGSRRPALLFDVDEGRRDDAGSAWHVAGTVPRFYRVQRPASVYSDASPLVESVAALASPVVRSGLSAADRLVHPSDEYDVTRHDELPEDALVSLYRRELPDGLHAVRDRAYLTWRYGHPGRSYRTYTAASDGRLEAAVVVGRRETDGLTVASLTDAYPVAGNDKRKPALAALLARVVGDVVDADLVTATGTAVPPSLLGRFGFVSGGVPVLPPAFGRQTLRTMSCRTQPQSPGSAGGYDPSDRASWVLTGSERIPR